MSADQIRPLLAPLVIVLAISVGGYLMFVEPIKRDLAEATARVDQARMGVLEQRQMTAAAPRLTAALQDAMVSSSVIDRLSEAARDNAGLFASLESIAARHGVQVVLLEPETSKQLGAGVRSDEPGARDGDLAIGYQMTVKSSYPDLAGFIDAIQHELGFTRINLVRITPVYDAEGQSVQATIRSVHYAFDTVPLAAPQASAEGGG